MEEQQLFKVLDFDGSPAYGGRGKWTPRRWRSVSGKLIPCKRGLHLCTLEQLPYWLRSSISIWRAEVHPSSEIILCEDKIVVRKARIVERLPWDDRVARLFAADCAEHVLGIFESALPDDDRPRRAIEAARAHANGEIGEEELRAAGDAAEAAARDAWAAAEAARYAAGDAAWAAAQTAWAAAWAAAEAARVAAWDAAGDARWRGDTDKATARERERRWQVKRLAHYLGL